MQRTGAMIVMFAMLLTSSGCGTMANLAGHDDWVAITARPRPPMPFGGVRNDIGIFAKACQKNDESPPNRDTGESYLGTTLGVSLLAMDPPLSLAADLLTLPWTTYVFVREKMVPSGNYDFKQTEIAVPLTPSSIPDAPRVEPPPLTLTK